MQMHICIFEYICIYVCEFTCIHVYMYMCIYVYMYGRFVHIFFTCICMYIHTHVCRCLCICMYIHTYYICIYVYMCIYICIRICTYVFVYVDVDAILCTSLVGPLSCRKRLRGVAGVSRPGRRGAGCDRDFALWRHCTSGVL